MKKNLGYITLIYFVCRSSFVGITFLAQSTLTNQNAWLSTICAIIIGILPISLFYFISKYKSELNIIEKINYLFPRTHNIIKSILFIGIFVMSLLVFWNLTTLANTQFLNKTPLLVISISFIIPIIYFLKQNNNTILRVGIILFYFSIILYAISFLGLINKVKLYNVLPLEFNPINGVLPYISYNILPIFALLIFPNNKIKENIFKGYFISSILILGATFLTISVLGIKLTSLLQFPELFILKQTFQGVLTFRLENFLIIQWVFDMFMFTSLGLKFCNEIFGIKKIYILPILLVIINNFIFSSIMKENNLIIYFFPKVIPIFLLVIPFIILIKLKKA